MTASSIALHLERPGGMSQSQVVRVYDDGGHSDILKSSANPAEMDFYDHTAPKLRVAGIAVPGCFWSEQRHGRSWLVLEDIPMPLPRSPRYPLPDARMLDTLARLHAVRLDCPPASWWAPAWPAGMTSAAIEALGQAGMDLADSLCVIQGRAQILFTPQCWISSDPNPSNWGLRPDGTAVLFDWERFGGGTPAIDLAITVAGLGTPEDCLALAREVIDLYPGTAAVEELAREIALAKCWTVVELLASVTRNEADVPPDLLAFLRTTAPGWISAIMAMSA